jgi:SRSO17 transposase
MAVRFPRVETRRRVRGFVLGLLADLPRKNCWTIAEHAGEADPHGMQYLLAWASWDTDGVRDDLRDYVTAALGDVDAVLVVDLCRYRDYVGLQAVRPGGADDPGLAARHSHRLSRKARILSGGR